MHDTICHMPQNHVVFFKDVFVESMWSTERCCVGVNKAGATRQGVHGNMRVETFCCKVRRTPAGHFGSEGCGSTQQRSMGLWAVAPAPVLWRVLLLWTWEGCFTLRATKLALFAQLHVRGTSRQYDYVIFKQWIGVVPLHVLPFRRRRTVTSQSSLIGLTDCDP